MTRRQNKVSLVIAFVLIIALAAGLTAVIVRMNNKETTKTLGTLDWKIGGLGETGLEIEDNSTIVTRNYVSIDGIKVTIDENAKIKYKVYYYTNEKVFIRAIPNFISTDLETTELPANAAYFKIVVQPTEDSEISLFEVSTYAGQLTVTVNK